MAESTTTESTSTSTEVTESENASLAQDQGLVDVLESDLMGIDDGATEETTKEESKEETSTDETTDDKSKETSTDTKKDETTKEDKTTETKSESESTESEKSASSESSDTIPKGLVKIEALHEARETNKFLKGRIQELEKQGPKVEEMQEEVIEVPEFKMLTETEFKTLSEDAPAEALQYMHKLEEHRTLVAKAEAATNAKAEAKNVEESNKDFTEQVVTNAIEQMETAIPGIFNDDKVVQTELVEFADSLGFTDDMFYLTNPETKIILPGTDEALLLGEQAVSILKTLASAKTKISEAKTSVDEKAIVARLRTEIEAELLAKFKEEKGITFKSLTTTTKTDDTNLGSNSEVLSDAEFNKLPEAEQEAYLTGA